MGAPRESRVVLLSLLHGVGGALCLLGARFPVAEDSPVALALLLGCVGLVVAAAIWVLGGRWGGAVAHAGFLLLGALVALLASRSVTPVGVVSLGPVLIAMALYAAHAFAPAAARGHVAGATALASAGAVAAEPSGFAVPWVVVVVTTVGVLEAQGHLSRRLRAAATTDPLTGVANRRAWEDGTARALRRCRPGEALTVVILDLDDFKQVNDAHGHAAGDALLRELVRSWAGHLRRTDLLGRYGGDEFVLTLPGTDERAARELIARLVASHPAPWSAGAATGRGADGLTALLERADAALYRGKQGRDRAREAAGAVPRQLAARA